MIQLNSPSFSFQYCIMHFKALSLYSCTLAPPCTGAMSLPIVCIMWLPRQCHLPIVTSQWVFTVTSLYHCYAPHFMNGAVTSALGKQHFVHCKFEQNYRLVIFNNERICFLNTFCANWHFQFTNQCINH